MSLTDKIREKLAFESIFQAMANEESGLNEAKNHEYGARWAHNYLHSVHEKLLAVVEAADNIEVDGWDFHVLGLPELEQALEQLRKECGG